MLLTFVFVEQYPPVIVQKITTMKKVRLSVIVRDLTRKTYHYLHYKVLNVLDK